MNALLVFAEKKKVFISDKSSFKTADIVKPEIYFRHSGN